MSTWLPSAVLAFLFQPLPASAQVYWPKPSDVGGIATLPTNDAAGVDSLLATIMTRFVQFASIVAIGVVIYAGYIYMTEITNKDAAAQAKKLVTYAVVGYLVVVLAYSIINVALKLPFFSTSNELQDPTGVRNNKSLQSSPTATPTPTP